MRMITILAAGSALAFAMAANAQTPSAAPGQPRAPAAAPQVPSAPPAIQSVDVVDITELPEETQTQITQVVAQRGDEQLQRLRTAVDANLMLKSALQSKGLSATHVLMAQMNENGALTLVTKRTG
nr:hypothetical protein [Bosea sp. PAMC 26642]